MRPIKEFQPSGGNSIDFVLMDIDDTLTTNGMLPASSYGALEKLYLAGKKVVPITGRPAGWCDHIARMWPVDGVVGENGALYFYYDRERKKMIRRFWREHDQRASDRRKLEDIRTEILSSVPGAGIASDQPYREADLAVDFCEDVPPLKEDDINRIVEIFEKHGAKAKISSIHVNGWFGDYDKLSMTKVMFREVFDVDMEKEKDRAIFAGDSPNDEPMFAFFTNSAGVANIRNFENKMKSLPGWVASREGGEGFSEIAEAILASC